MGFCVKVKVGFQYTNIPTLPMYPKTKQEYSPRIQEIQCGLFYLFYFYKIILFFFFKIFIFIFIIFNF